LEERLKEFLLATYKTSDVRNTQFGSVFYNRYRNFLFENYGLKLSTLESQLKALKAVAMQAHKDGILSRNPFLGCKAQKIDYERREM